MNMQSSVNYKLLKLPNNPIKDSININEMISSTDKDESNPHRRGLQFNCNDILKPEIIQIFESYNIVAQRIVLFTLPSPRKLSNALLHADLEPIDNLQWKKVIYGVNWELNNIQSHFSWYETTREPTYPPSHPGNVYPNGIHYGSRFKFGIYTEQDKLVEKVNTNIGPLLVRTDIPHAVEVEESTSKIRVALSIRFENTVDSWDEALQLFSPLIA